MNKVVYHRLVLFCVPDDYHAVLQSLRPGTTYGGCALSRRSAGAEYSTEADRRYGERTTRRSVLVITARVDGQHQLAYTHVCAVVETRLKYVRVQDWSKPSATGSGTGIIVVILYRRQKSKYFRIVVRMELSSR